MSKKETFKFVSLKFAKDFYGPEFHKHAIAVERDDPSNYLGTSAFLIRESYIEEFKQSKLNNNILREDTYSNEF